MDPDATVHDASAREKGASRLVDFALVNSTEAVLFMVQNNCIDMNAWYSRVDKPERPDFVLFDLDPPEEPDGFELAIDVAHLIRELLDEVGLPGYVKTSGADGIHVVAPITRRSTFQQTYDFAERASRLLEARHPGLVTTRVAEEEARGRPRRPPPERLGQDDRVGVLRAAEARRAGLDAAALGRAAARHQAARLHDGRSRCSVVAEHGDLFAPVLEDPRPLAPAARALAKLAA